MRLVDTLNLYPKSCETLNIVDKIFYKFAIKYILEVNPFSFSHFALYQF